MTKIASIELEYYLKKSHTSILFLQVKTRKKTDYSLYTPLHFAVKNGRTEIAKFLSQCLHVDVGKVDANSSSPLHLALECGDMEILDCLLAHDKVHADNING